MWKFSWSSPDTCTGVQSCLPHNSFMTAYWFRTSSQHVYFLEIGHLPLWLDISSQEKHMSMRVYKTTLLYCYTVCHPGLCFYVTAVFNKIHLKANSFQLGRLVSTPTSPLPWTIQKQAHFSCKKREEKKEALTCIGLKPFSVPSPATSSCLV